MDATDASPWAPRSAPIRFTGANAAFRRLVTHGAMRELLTFGFYRFWLTTDLRRHLWANTEVDGTPLEYTGRGKELLLGFLFAMAVMGPLFLLYFLAGLAAERVKAFASLPLTLFLYLFGQFAVYRARRYRLTRTIWRGVRFWMTGSGWAYAARSLLWGLLLVPSCGFAYPWYSAALERYKLGHTFYGTLPGRFVGTGWELFQRVWWIWLLGLLPVVLLVFGMIGAVVARLQGATASSPAMVGAGLLILAGCVLLLALPFLHAARRAAEWRWWVEGVRFGDAAIACVLPRWALIGVYWSLIGMSLLVVVVFAALAGVIAGVTASGPAPAGSLAARMAHLPAWGLVAYVVWYLALLLALGAVARIYLLQRVWRRVVSTCVLLNPAVVAEVAAAGETVGAFGEGLADGLDLAGF